MHVLLIEDDGLLAELLSAIITEQGHTVDHIETVAAFDKTKDLRNYGAVITDYKLPDGNGCHILSGLYAACYTGPVLFHSSAVHGTTATGSLLNFADLPHLERWSFTLTVKQKSGDTAQYLKRFLQEAAALAA